MEKEGWGKKKAYWSGDTADLEIGQDVQDAEDEEEAAEVNYTKCWHYAIIWWEWVLVANNLKNDIN